MLENLLIGLPTMALCLLLQAVLFTVVIRYYLRRSARVDRASFWTSVNIVNSVMLMLVIGNLAQLTIWAVLFRWLGEFDNLADAVYHSAVNFATLGYGDIVMSEHHRLLGPLEAINGVLMIGMSTAGLTTAIQDVLRRTRAAKKRG